MYQFYVYYGLVPKHKVKYEAPLSAGTQFDYGGGDTAGLLSDPGYHQVLTGFDLRFHGCNNRNMDRIAVKLNGSTVYVSYQDENYDDGTCYDLVSDVSWHA